MKKFLITSFAVLSMAFAGAAIADTYALDDGVVQMDPMALDPALIATADVVLFVPDELVEADVQFVIDDSFDSATLTPLSPLTPMPPLTKVLLVTHLATELAPWSHENTAQAAVTDRGSGYLMQLVG